MAWRRLKKCLHRPQVQYTWKASHCRLRWRRLNHNLLFYCFPLSSRWPSVETLFADPFVKTCRCRRCCSRSRCHLLVQPVKILSLDSSGQTQAISSSFLFFFVKPASSQRWTTNHRWSTAGWREFRWGRGNCTWRGWRHQSWRRCGRPGTQLRGRHSNPGGPDNKHQPEHDFQKALHLYVAIATKASLRGRCIDGVIFPYWWW